MGADGDISFWASMESDCCVHGHLPQHTPTQDRTVVEVGAGGRNEPLAGEEWRVLFFLPRRQVSPGVTVTALFGERLGEGYVCRTTGVPPRR